MAALLNWAIHTAYIYIYIYVYIYICIDNPNLEVFTTAALIPASPSAKHLSKSWFLFSTHEDDFMWLLDTIMFSDFYVQNLVEMISSRIILTVWTFMSWYIEFNASRDPRYVRTLCKTRGNLQNSLRVDFPQPRFGWYLLHESIIIYGFLSNSLRYIHW